jgi:hypothetical protein
MGITVESQTIAELVNVSKDCFKKTVIHLVHSYLRT